jgi:hypothetical protein
MVPCLGYIVLILSLTMFRKQCFDPDPDKIRIQGGKNDPQKQKKLRNFMFLSAGCSLLRA